jgi:uncharacterized protein YjbI with pentapeptide repeats
MSKFNKQKINLINLLAYILTFITIFLGLGMVLIEQNTNIKIITISIMFVFLVIIFFISRPKKITQQTSNISLQEPQSHSQMVDDTNIEKIFNTVSINEKIDLLNKIVIEVDNNSKKLEAYYDLLCNFLENIASESTYDENNNHIIKSFLETLCILPKYDTNGKAICPKISNIIIKNMTLKNLNFNNMVILNSTFVNVDFSTSKFINTNFIGTNFIGGSVESCNFKNAKFGNKINNDTLTLNSKVNKFTRTNIGSTNFGSSKIEYCEFISVNNADMTKLFLLHRKFNKKVVIHPQPVLMPNIDDKRWRYLLLGNINHEFKCIPASFLLSRLRNKIKQDSSETSITKCIDEIYTFFCKYQSVISDDIQKIFN